MMEARYLPLKHDEGAEVDFEVKAERRAELEAGHEAEVYLDLDQNVFRSWGRFILTHGFVILLFATNLSWVIFFAVTRARLPAPLFELPVHPEFSTVSRRFWWDTTDYSDPNSTIREDVWASIDPFHGLIAVDKDKAETQDWPESRQHPEDKTKSLYFLEGYYEIYCLKLARTAFHDVVSGAKLEHWTSFEEDINNCLNYLMQVTICNADALPLSIGEGIAAGDGQTHVCKDWNGIRDFAAENPSCCSDASGYGETLAASCSSSCAARVDGLITER